MTVKTPKAAYKDIMKKCSQARKQSSPNITAQIMSAFEAENPAVRKDLVRWVKHCVDSATWEISKYAQDQMEEITK